MDDYRVGGRTLLNTSRKLKNNSFVVMATVFQPFPAMSVVWNSWNMLVLKDHDSRNSVHGDTTYKAFAELGKAVKTIFLCRYLHSEASRREINEGLNVIEQWNGANDFVFFARRGELVSNRSEDHEVSMLALHLLQNCMVYINTLIQAGAGMGG